MRAQGIVRGQRVERVKAQRARDLRQEMTAEEGLLWERLRGEALGGLHFRRQQIVETVGLFQLVEQSGNDLLLAPEPLR